MIRRIAFTSYCTWTWPQAVHPAPPHPPPDTLTLQATCKDTWLEKHFLHHPPPPLPFSFIVLVGAMRIPTSFSFPGNACPWSHRPEALTSRMNKVMSSSQLMVRLQINCSWSCSRLLRGQVILVAEHSAGGLSSVRPVPPCAWEVQRVGSGEEKGQWGILFPWQPVCWGHEQALLWPLCHPSLVGGLSYSHPTTQHSLPPTSGLCQRMY